MIGKAHHLEIGADPIHNTSHVLLFCHLIIPLVEGKNGELVCGNIRVAAGAQTSLNPV
jgi:hypothetical protein